MTRPFQFILATASLSLTVGLTACGSRQAKTSDSLSSTASSRYNNVQEARGNIQRFLLTSHGEIEGFILDDGTQVSFPVLMSAQVGKALSLNDPVYVRGYFENDRVFKAEKIINTKTSKTITGMVSPPPTPKTGYADATPGPGVQTPGRIDERMADRKVLRDRRNLKPFSTSGTVESQFYNHDGEMSGVVLSNGAVIHFTPGLLDESKANTNIGESLKASGYGTQNSRGQAIDATEIVNE